MQQLWSETEGQPQPSSATVGQVDFSNQPDRDSTDVLKKARETYVQVVNWQQSLDAKLTPILTAAAALVAGSLAVVGQQDTFRSTHPYTDGLLFFSILPLLYSVTMAVQTVSPSLQLGGLGKRRHIVDKSTPQPTSVMFFGQIARFKDADEYGEAAKIAYQDNMTVLDDLLAQTYVNSKLAEEKCIHIAHSARGLFVGVVMILCAGLAFASGH